MTDSSTLLSGRINKPALTWLVVAVLVTTPLEALGFDRQIAYVSLPFRLGALLIILFALRTDRIGPIWCGRLLLAQGLVTMSAWTFLLEPTPDRVALTAVAYGTILSIFALLIAPKAHRRWWSGAVAALALVQAAVFLLPDDGVLLMQAAAVLVVHGAAVAMLDVHTNRAERVSEMAAIDSLTGLFNRRATIERLEQQIAAHGDDGSATILLLDLDHFKVVNDTRGHAAGDRVLVEVADAMTAAVRPSDTVCRWGGEEFLLLFPDTDQKAAVRTAERVLTSIAETGVTASIGVAEVRSGDTVDGWVRRADIALYTAKNEGRNRVSTNVIRLSLPSTPRPSELHEQPLVDHPIRA